MYFFFELTGISRDGDKGPYGLKLVPWERGWALLWDTTCTDRLAPSRVRKTTLKARAAVEKDKT